MEIVLIFGEHLARIVCEILRVRVTSKKVLVKKVPLLHDEKTKNGKCKIKKEAVYTFCHHLDLDLAVL
jgi:hypothetical protein